MKSWVASANEALTDFPLENLPFGVFRRADGAACVGVAIGDRILDLRASAGADLLAGVTEDVVKTCTSDSLNALMGLGRSAVSELRGRLMELLAEASARFLHRAFPGAAG